MKLNTLCVCVLQNGVKYIESPALKAMAAVALASKKKSLEEFEAAVRLFVSVLLMSSCVVCW